MGGGASVESLLVIPRPGRGLAKTPVSRAPPTSVALARDEGLGSVFDDGPSTAALEVALSSTRTSTNLVGGYRRSVTEQQPYEVVQSYPTFELRRYPPHLEAEVSVHGSFEEAGNRAFRSLFGYITGQNESARSVAMTAPVVQENATSEKIAMTAPVVQVENSSGDALYDRAALRAITDANPFPPLPAEFRESALLIHLGFDFTADRG